MRFEEKVTLARRSNIEQMASEEVDGLLVGEKVIHCWEEGNSQYGYDSCSIRPAFTKGQKGWLVTKDWVAAPKYSADGTVDRVLTFEEGVRMLLDKGAFEHIFNQEEV